MEDSVESLPRLGTPVLDFLNSLSLQSGALVVAIASAILSVLVARLRVTVARWTVAVTTPLVLAYSLYWLPVWLGDSPMEYRAWAPLFIVPWYVAGVMASVAAMLIVTRLVVHTAKNA